MQSNHKVKKEAVLLCSGGLDSTTLAYWLKSQSIPYIPLFLDYGQHCANTEYERLTTVLPEEYAKKIKRIDISDIYKGNQSLLIKEADLWLDPVDDKDMYLPYRNLIMLSIGAIFAQTNGIERVYAAFINSNHVKEIDCTTSFFDQLAKLLSNYGSIKIELPFREMTKLDVARLGLELGAPIANTFSCQTSSKIPCGACPNCVERLDALEAIAQEH
ncbi:MAG: 7-cyano-7-deazaguanine synthase [Deltaproteobacteria bacterium]|nr:7-cyano-7-deazaguanine synthase [Deltaproteobacteria bacterium]